MSKKPDDKAKSDKDIEEFLEKEVIHLDNGSIHPMVSRFRTNTFWTYLCFPCGATCLGEVFLQSHLHGKKHNIQILSRNKWPASIVNEHPYYTREANKPNRSQTNSTSSRAVEEVVVAPGEPVPPGIEEVVKVSSALEDNLKTIDVPIIGLEYMVELIKDDRMEPAYFCGLCGTRGDPRTILKHLEGFRHKMRYMAIHYPTCHTALRKYTGQEKYYPGNVQLLYNICECIQQAYGRLKPLVMNFDEFEENRPKYLKQLADGKHFTEKDGGNFEELIDEEYVIMVSNTSKVTMPEEDSLEDLPHKLSPLIDNTDGESNKKKITRDKTEKLVGKKSKKSLRVKRLSVDSISSLSNVSEEDLDNDCIILTSPGKGEFKPKARQQNKNLNLKNESTANSRKDVQFPLSSPINNRNRNYRRNSRSPIRDRSPRTRQVRSRSVEKNSLTRTRTAPNVKVNVKEDKKKWVLYRKKFNQCCEEAKKIFEFNEQFPEKHPSYQEEWKKFWNKKYKEFQGDKKDIWQCDMKPEWIKFWSKKMRDLHDEGLVKKREEILKELDLPLDSELTTVDPPPREYMYKYNKPQEPAFTSRNPKIDRGNTKKAQDNSKERDKNYRGRSPDKNRDMDRRGRSRDKSSERRPVERERNKRSHDGSWDRTYEDRRRDRDMRSKYGEKDSRDAKMRRISPSPHDMKSSSSKHYSSSRYFSEQMSKVERERKDVKWSIYHSKMRIHKSKLMVDLEEYEENPKSHPSYHNEWLKFRSENCDDKNINNIDVNTEWLKLWRRKLKEKFDDEIQIKRNDLLKELGLNRETSSEFEYYERKYDKESPEPRLRQKDMRKSKESKVSAVDLENLNVVVVLRHLTALENYLGSLGPKVIDLLAAVLKMEKVKPNSSEDILTNDIYLVLLETVKEKLKGQLLADLIDSHATQATKVAIQYTATLLHKATLRAEEEKRKLEELKFAKSLPVAGVGPVEKAAIATQIAAALVAQGKTDVSTEELEKLINAVVGMANASHIPLTETNSFGDSLLSQLMNMHNASASIAKESSSKNDENNKSMNGLQALQTAYDKNTVAPVPVATESAFSDKLSDSDLKTLLQNFKDLSSDEQHGLVTYLKRLETKYPQRVDNLKKIFNIDLYLDKQSSPTPFASGRLSPFSNRACGMNPSVDEKPQINSEKKDVKPFSVKSKDSDDDEDYSYEEVIKCAAEKVKERQFLEEFEIIKQSLIDGREEPDVKIEPPEESDTKPNDNRNQTNNEKTEIDAATLASVLELVKNASSLLPTNSPQLAHDPMRNSPSTKTGYMNLQQRDTMNTPPMQHQSFSMQSNNNNNNQNMQSNARDTMPKMSMNNQYNMGEQQNRSLLPQSSGLYRNSPDTYISKPMNMMDQTQLQNRNVPSQNTYNAPMNKFSGENTMADNFHYGAGGQSKFDNQNKMNSYSTQMNVTQHDSSNRYVTNKDSFKGNNQPNMSWNNSQTSNQFNSQNSSQFNTQTPSQFNSQTQKQFNSQIPSLFSSQTSNQFNSQNSNQFNSQNSNQFNSNYNAPMAGNNTFSTDEFNKFNNTNRGRGAQRNPAGRGRGTNRPYGDYYRRGGAANH